MYGLGQFALSGWTQSIYKYKILRTYYENSEVYSSPTHSSFFPSLSLPLSPIFSVVKPANCRTGSEGGPIDTPFSGDSEKGEKCRLNPEAKEEGGRISVIECADPDRQSIELQTNKSHYTCPHLMEIKIVYPTQDS